MEKLILNGVNFEKSKEIYPISDGVYYKNEWYTPIKQVVYKVNDWVIYTNKAKSNSEIRKIVETDNYNIKLGIQFDKNYGNWMTLSAAKDYEDCLKLATEKEIYQYLQKLAKEKGLIKGTKVKRSYDNRIVQIVQEDDGYFQELDQYGKSGIILYSKGEWVTKYEEPKLTFGGHPVDFILCTSGLKYNFKTIEVYCKGEIGTNFQIEKILKNYFRPLSFGNVFVKSYKLTELNAKLNNEYNVCLESNDIHNVDTITIGCLTGKYSELVEIHKECQRLLKNN